MPFAPSDSADLVAWYDFGDITSLIKGGYDFSGGTKYAELTGADPPNFSSGSPAYPFSIVCWFKVFSTAAASRNLVTLHAGTASNRLQLYSYSTDVYAYVEDSGGYGQAVASGGITANTWHCAIAVFVSSSSRFVYSNANTTGGSNSTSRSPVGIDTILISSNGTIGGNANGVVAYTAILPYDLSGAGQASNRQAIFNGFDPLTVTSLALSDADVAVWKLDNDSGADASDNNYDLTLNGSPTAQNFLIVGRDKSGSNYHFKATTSAPTWDSTAFSNYGGANFVRASSQFMLAPPAVTAAPFQVFTAVRCNDITNDHGILYIGDKDAGDEGWWVGLRGAVANDPAQFRVGDPPSVAGAPVNNYPEDTDFLIYVSEASATSRSIEVNVGTPGTNTTNLSPDNTDRMALGRFDGTGPSSYLDGQVGGIVIIDTASTAEKSDFEGWFNTTYSLGLSLPNDLQATATISGVGTLTASALLDFGPRSSLTGIGSLLTTSFGDFGLSATITGIGSLYAVGAASVEWEASATITGVGSLSGPLVSLFENSPVITGTGNVIPQTTQQARSNASLSGTGGFLRVFAEQYRYQTTNPPLSGDLIPVTNQSRFLLTVNTTPVSLGHPYYNMEELYIGYDKKTLSFSEIATPTIGNPTWSPEGNVKLQIDFDDGEGLVTYFTGQINRRIHEGVNNAETIRYQAEGIQTLANRVTLTNTTGWPVVTFTVGTTVLTVINSTDVTTTFSKTIREAVLDLFTVMSSTLSANSISTDIYTPTLSLLSGDLPETVVLSGQGFAQGVQQVVSYLPGKRLFWDDPLQMWTFVDVVNAPILVSQIESSQLEQLTYDVSTEGRFTAIRLMADESALDDNIYTQAGTLETPRGNFQLTRETVDLTPYWDETARATWSVWNMSTPFPQNMGDDWFWVYRRWQMPENLTEEWPGTPITFFAQSQMVEGDATSLRWERFRARANFRRRTVISQYPIVQPWSNVWELGSKHAAPISVKMVYYPRNVVNGTIVTSVTNAGTQVTVTTLFDSSFLLDQIRYPASGYEGTAHSVFGIERELIELVSPTEVTTANAASKLSLLKDVVVTGELPYKGDPVKSFMNLGLKVQVQHASKLTGIQSFAGYMTQYRYSFGRPGTNYVGLTTDRGEVI